MDSHSIYRTPLTSRYSSDRMKQLFSEDVRYQTWRKLWISLAAAEKAMGLDISDEQIEDLRKHAEDINYGLIRERERLVKHDVMAHIYGYGQQAQSAAGIIHLGATSCYVTDNGDLIIYRKAMKYLQEELLKVMKNLADFAGRYKDLPTLSYTHYQPAQLTTVGKRAGLWLQDFYEDYLELSSLILEMKFLGCRGTTGTEASFLKLFDNDEEKIDRMNKMIAADFGFESCYDLCAQTYPRKTDSRILAVLSSIGQSAYKMAQDIRLLQHDGEISEPFESDQVGSSAMPYKKNPMRSERVCSLSRYLISLSANPEFTAATQWLERSLDDSANRRIVMPEAFLCADAIVRLVQNITQGLVVNERIIRRRVMEYLPFIETENLMMEAVRNGADRQKVHEIIRICSLKASENISSGRAGNLIGMLAEHEEFGMSEAEMTELLEPEKYTGRSSHQVTAFLNKIEPLLKDVTADKAEMEM